MRILIVSDIHANLTAFEAVMADVKGKWDTIWCLGDLVGYGPDPNECVELLCRYDHISLSGNHDWAVLGKIDINSFNDNARMAVQWTQETLKPANRDYLESLPTMLVKESFTLAHASPRQPVWEYILDPYTAAANFPFFDTPYCLVGHSHVPILFEQENADKIIPVAPIYGETIHLNANRLLINPGSVGQPRDHDPRAAYALLDTETMSWEHRRVKYPVEETQERMRMAEMPSKLIKRLEWGW